MLFSMATFSRAGIDNNSSSISWYNLEEAQLMAKEQPKPIFIEFTAKWCGWCKKMDKTTFSDNKVVKALNENYYAVKVDFDSKELINFRGKDYTGKELAEQFGIEGLPTMIYVPKSLKGSEKIVGYKTSKQLMKKLNQLDQS